MAGLDLQQQSTFRALNIRTLTIRTLTCIILFLLTLLFFVLLLLLLLGFLTGLSERLNLGACTVLHPMGTAASRPGVLTLREDAQADVLVV